VIELALLATGCQASTATQARVAAPPEETVIDADRQLEAPPLPPIPRAAAEDERPLFGARHDLSYAGPPSDVCRCLAVRVEESELAPTLHWAAAPPQLDSGSQWVVALSSQGVRCEGAPQGTLGASYQGYEINGSDVIVFVAALTEGQPLTSGGIIPKPSRDGAVFVEAVGSVYGKPLQGDQARCKVPTPAVATGSAPAPPNPIGAIDAPSSGVRFAQSPGAESPAAPSPAAPSPAGTPSNDGCDDSLNWTGNAGKLRAKPQCLVAPSRSEPSPGAPARGSATAAARPINDGCGDSLYWTDKAGIRRVKPQCL